MIKKESHTVPKQEKTSRLSDYSVGIFCSIYSRMGMKKAILKGLVLVNGEKGTTGRFIYGGETIDLLEDDQKQKNRKKLNLSLDVIYEDDYIAVVYKPAGILVSGNKFKTIENALVENLKPGNLIDSLRNPHPAHRLDFATSGLLLIGKTSTALSALNKMFENKEIQKTYTAITIGKMDDEGIIESNIDGKASKSKYVLIESLDSPKFEKLNLVKLTPFTGRRHQLRIHLLEISNPILGDKTYFKEGLILNGKGLFLHASNLQFKHPISQEDMNINIKLPKKFTHFFPSHI